MIKKFNTLYFNFSNSIEKHSILIMRISLAIVYIWFGALKIFGMSPAGELVEKTVYWLRPEIFIPILGICEVIIGLGLLVKRFIPITILLLLLHMIVTFFPVFILQTACFDSFPYCPTLVGQYIIKNLVLISGALVIAGKFNKKYFNEAV
ncbi:DoxX family membrane protein [Flavobacterium franklandianum]|uniref:DoxX family membrane protein n=1 Tax=Flavobacterium franklandianum TaxID=2594430 RepID=A0A553CUE2_9FLAO|nr:DoxX family membrane protein [Flavobacterium franklandianum]TRX24044.1 DoxX family membrane protein [Flavobacterium franklandianum]TRX25378.1 DoxX family membrane protein [Flavobacterium franklandianum]